MTGTLIFPLEAVTDVRSLLDDLRHGLEREVHKDFVNDGPAAGHRRADGHSRSSQFADARVAKPVIAELFPEVPGLTKIPAPRPNTLADVDDGVVALHLLAKRFHSGIDVTNLARSFSHAILLEDYAQNTWSKTVVAEGSGLSLANCTASSSQC